MNPSGARAASAQITATIGERLRAAREAAGLPQLEAARLLGYANSSKLSKIEWGRSSEIPMWVLKRAGWLYDVSTDYLLGSARCMAGQAGIPDAITDSVVAGLIHDTDRRRADAEALVELTKQRRFVRRLVGVVAPLGDELAGAQAAVEQEDSWQDVRGGSRWAASSEGAAELLGRVRELAATL